MYRNNTRPSNLLLSHFLSCFILLLVMYFVNGQGNGVNCQMY